MKQAYSRAAIINGYGVPKNILTDKSYHAYLVTVYNYLWDRYRGERLLIVLAGGPTDMDRPYRRTEAGDMKRWLKIHMRGSRERLPWVIQTIATELTALENMLAAKKKIAGLPVIYFCEMTRRVKMQKLASEVFGNCVHVLGIDFDGSPARYDRAIRKDLEREDLKYSLRALQDPAWRKRLRAAAQEKIRRLRGVSPSKRRQLVDRIAFETRRAYAQKYFRS